MDELWLPVNGMFTLNRDGGAEGDNPSAARTRLVLRRIRICWLLISTVGTR